MSGQGSRPRSSSARRCRSFQGREGGGDQEAVLQGAKQWHRSVQVRAPAGRAGELEAALFAMGHVFVFPHMHDLTKRTGFSREESDGFANNRPLDRLAQALIDLKERLNLPRMTGICPLIDDHAFSVMGPARLAAYPVVCPLRESRRYA